MVSESHATGAAPGNGDDYRLEFRDANGTLRAVYFLYDVPTDLLAGTSYAFRVPYTSNRPDTQIVLPTIHFEPIGVPDHE